MSASSDRVCTYCGEAKDDVDLVAGDPTCEECLEHNAQQHSELELLEMELIRAASEEDDE